MARLNVTVPSVEFSMSQSVTFTPQYAQPFTLQEATGLELDSLIAGKWLWLQRSTRRLTGSRGEPPDQLARAPVRDAGPAAGIHGVGGGAGGSGGGAGGVRGVPGERGADVGVFSAGRGLTWRPRQGERVALLCAAVVNKAGNDS